MNQAVDIRLEIKMLREKLRLRETYLFALENDFLESMTGYERKSASFFVEQIRYSRNLLVGEGNMSFALSLANKPEVNPTGIVATTYEEYAFLPKLGKENRRLLCDLGVSVYHGIDATKLDISFVDRSFGVIIFQFPNVGSRKPIRGRNPNSVLIEGFLKSASKCLQSRGKVMITAVDNPYYSGAFQFEEAAKKAGFKSPKGYMFDLDSFPEYIHTNTNSGGSALNKHKKLLTWIFYLK